MARTCKFYKIKQLVSYDCGESWEATGRYDKGALYEANSRDCGFILIYRWALSAGDYDCDGVRKYNMEVLQFTTEQGGEYQNVSPEYKRRAGSVVDWLSTDCGYVESTGGFKFSGTSVVNCGTKPSGSAYTESTLYRQEVSAITAPHSIVGDCTEVIGSSAFSGSVLETIDISSYTKEIQDYAFADCSGITSMVIPDTVEKVGVGLFKGCVNLTGATLPSGIDYIPSYTFAGCSAYTSPIIPNNTRVIGSYSYGSGRRGFSGETYIHSIPSGVTDIYDFTDANFSSGLTLPDGLKYIGEWREVRCSSGLTLPSGIEHITSFAGCELAPQAIPGSVKLIPYEAFYDSSIGDDYYPAPSGITLSNGTEFISNGSFYDYDVYTDHNVPEVTPNTVNVLLGKCGFTDGGDNNKFYTVPSNVQIMDLEYVYGVSGFYADVILNQTIPPLLVSYDGVEHITNNPPSAMTAYSVFVPDESYELYKLMWGNISKIKPRSYLQYEWRNADISSEYECVGVDKHYKKYKYVSKDSGNTWYNTEVSCIGDLYEANSYDCGYRTRVLSGDSYCVGCDLYVPTTSQTSYDYGETWTTTSTAETLVRQDSVECGCVHFVLSYTNNSGETSYVLCSDTTAVSSPYPSGSLLRRTTVSAHIGACATSIEKEAFDDNRELTSLTIDSTSIATLGEYAFEYCYKLNTIDLSGQTLLTEIPGACFAYSTGLTQVSLPAGITTIGYRAFQNMRNCVITIAATSVPSIYTVSSASHSFRGVSNLTIKVPAASVSAYQSAWGGISGITSIEAI